jgi:hypothetical protein
VSRSSELPCSEPQSCARRWCAPISMSRIDCINRNDTLRVNGHSAAAMARSVQMRIRFKCACARPSRCTRDPSKAYVGDSVVGLSVVGLGVVGLGVVGLCKRKY